MSRRTLSKKALFRIEHPNCCFCGGTRPATTRDHVPPEACFPRGLCPEEFEFPSCASRNNGHSRHDTIFGFYSMLLDFNEENRTPADHKRLEKLRDEVGKRYPDALPDPATHEPIYRAGNIITPSPVALSVEVKPAVKAAMLAVGAKLTHALYYREMKRFVTPKHRFFTSVYQLQRLGTEDLTAYFKKMRPNLRIGRRQTSRNMGTGLGTCRAASRKKTSFYLPHSLDMGW